MEYYYEEVSSDYPCGSCDGRGYTEYYEEDLDGVRWNKERTCSNCGGSGSV